MLIITRKTGSGVKIGENIFVHVTKTMRGRVHLAIVAPRELKVLRVDSITKKADPVPRHD